MKNRIVPFAAAIALAATLGACSGSANVAVTNPIPAIQSYIAGLRASGSATTAVETTKTQPQVQQTAPDLTPYRCEYDAAVKAWIVYYYSPSQKKSYKCQPKEDKTVTIVEVTDTTLVYTEGDTLDTSKVTVDATAAAEKAAATTTASPAPSASATPAPSGGTTTVTNNTVVINNITLISAAEARKKHKKDATNPVYVVVTNNTPVYIDASTGNTITATATDGGAVSVGGGTAVGGTVGATPTAAPSVAPTAAPSTEPVASPTPTPAPTTTPAT